MNDELRAAAQEAIAWYRAQSPHVAQRKQARLLKTLAQGILTEHPADDAEPVTVEWLAQCGFERNASYFTLPNYSGNIFDIVLWADGFNVRWDGQTNCKTRGDVRRLCAALGIKLAEGEG